MDNSSQLNSTTIRVKCKLIDADSYQLTPDVVRESVVIFTVSTEDMEIVMDEVDIDTSHIYMKLTSSSPKCLQLPGAIFGVLQESYFLFF